MSKIKARLRIGSTFRLTPDALENYGAKYANQTFTVSHVSTAYMPAAEFYAKGKPTGYHPGFDESAGCALYDAEELTFSVYEWEIEAV